MVYYYLKKENVDLSTFKNMEERIKAVKGYFIEDIQENLGHIYTILSKGIHELDEEICSKYYVFLEEIILLQLQHVKAEKEHRNRVKMLKSSILEIVESIK